MNKTFIVIPAYDESKNIATVIKKVKKYYGNIVVVDDGSRDKTAEAAKKAGALVLRHIVNMGKGAALKTGCDYALKKKAKTIVVIDADGQHDPEDIPRFIKSLKGKDIVFSYRKLYKRMPLILKFGNIFINAATNALYSINLQDTQCGFRAFTAEAYKKIRWNAIDYSMESEMITRVGKNHLKYAEIPIKTVYSDRYKGTTIFDGIKIVFNMILWRLKK